MLQLSPYFVIHNFAHFRAKSPFHSLNVSPELLLQHVPVGTDSESAVAALSKESFDCKTSRWPSHENSRRRLKTCTRAEVTRLIQLLVLDKRRASAGFRT